MKRSLIVWTVRLVSPAFLTAVPAQADRYVQSNNFVSTTPQLKVTVSPPFRYIGQAESGKIVIPVAREV
jgi:hypothetical protein